MLKDVKGKVGIIKECDRKLIKIYRVNGGNFGGGFYVFFLKLVCGGGFGGCG